MMCVSGVMSVAVGCGIDGAAWRVTAVVRAIRVIVIAERVSTLAGVVSSAMPVWGRARDTPDSLHGLHPSENPHVYT